MSGNYGFILTRYVNSEQTNKYWNQCVKLLRSSYPHKQIVIIDDNSNQDFIKAEFDYQNLTIIKSEYPGRGELLPYIYLQKYRWFPSAVIIHDSVFIHKRIPFEVYNANVVPLWHASYDKEHLPNLLRIARALKNNNKLIDLLSDNNNINILGIHKNKFNLCFGGQSFIKLEFIDLLEQKYGISNLVNVIHNRIDRCGLERILGGLFTLEYPNIKILSSLFGNIFNQYKSFNYHYDEYINDFNNKKIPKNILKVWTGR